MKKYICLFLSTLMFLTIFSPVNCYARDGKKVIRVGFYTLANYQECDENGNYSGNHSLTTGVLFCGFLMQGIK